MALQTNNREILRQFAAHRDKHDETDDKRSGDDRRVIHAEGRIFQASWNRCPVSNNQARTQEVAQQSPSSYSQLSRPCFSFQNQSSSFTIIKTCDQNHKATRNKPKNNTQLSADPSELKGFRNQPVMPDQTLVFSSPIFVSFFQCGDCSQGINRRI